MSINLAEVKLFSFMIHTGQFRRQTKDLFMLHILRIDEFLLSKFGFHKDINIIRACALLHDSVEDTWVTADYLKSRFGDRVASIVFELSKSGSQEDYVSKLRSSSDLAKIIKLADVWDNVHDGFGSSNPSKWSKFLDDSLVVINALVLENELEQFNIIKKELKAKIISLS